MDIEFGYGDGVITVAVPDENLMGILYANVIEHERFGTDAVSYALQHPIGKPYLRKMVRSDDKIVIIVSDISRPVPSYEILPAILDELYAANCKKENIKIIFALGSHRNHTEDEKRKLVGNRVYNTIECMDSNDYGFRHIGTTRAGTPVDICAAVAEADFRICTGNIEFHYFAGYSGGAKAIMPGVSSPEAIQVNHRMMTLENARSGKLEDNPVREDIEEAGRICGIDYIVNVVLDENKRIAYAVAGDAKKAYKEGCKVLDMMYRKEIKEKADIVIVGQGGAPKDSSLYQVQKALDNAKHAVREGGTIILVGACQEGLGNKKFEDWLKNAPTAHSIIDRINKKFELGGHKAAAIAMVLEKVRIDLVSELEDGLVRSIHLNPQPSVKRALDEAIKRYSKNATVLAMPFGGATLPFVNEKEVRK